MQETSLDESPAPTQSTLWFQWCRYLYDNGEEPQYGYRFIWRRPNDDGGGLQAARGQARIPSVAIIEQFVAKAKKAGWGHYDGDNFPNGLVMLWTSVDDILDPKIESEQRRSYVKAFVQDVAFGGLSLYEFERVIVRVPTGGAYSRGDIFKNSQELYQALDSNDRDQLKTHFFERVENVEKEFPELVQEFPGQFRK
jgi:hypothetical protein